MGRLMDEKKDEAVARTKKAKLLDVSVVLS